MENCIRITKCMLTESLSNFRGLYYSKDSALGVLNLLAFR